MIHVLHKAFDMLEYLAQEAGRRRKLNEIAAHLGLNAGTCANILKTMVQRKYVDQEKARGGYLPGPMIHYLSRMSDCRADLVSIAEPLMLDLVKHAKENVLLAVLHGGKRSSIIQIDGNQSVQINSDLFVQGDVYKTATGRLLLAHLDKKKLKNFIVREGLPGARWPEAASREKMDSALAAIRRQKVVCYQSSRDIVGIASPIIDKGKVVAALGLFLPAFRFKGVHKKVIIKGISATANAISERLSKDEFVSRTTKTGVKADEPAK